MEAVEVELLGSQPEGVTRKQYVKLLQNLKNQKIYKRGITV